MNSIRVFKFIFIFPQLACENDLLDLVKLLLAVDGININVRDANNMTPMDYAKLKENNIIITLLNEKENSV